MTRLGTAQRNLDNLLATGKTGQTQQARTQQPDSGRDRDRVKRTGIGDGHGRDVEVGIEAKERTVDHRVIEAAQAVPLPTDQEILHLMCREFVVDGAGGIPDPVGLRGVRLEAHLHVISACESVLANLERCCHKAGLSVQQIIASSLASAEAVLDPAEKEVGVGLIDFGAGTVDIAVYHGGSVVHSAVLPIRSTKANTVRQNRTP